MGYKELGNLRNGDLGYILPMLMAIEKPKEIFTETKTLLKQ